MTSQPKTAPAPSQSESAAANTAETAATAAPLDRSSAEWRGQFGVLPSPYQQSGAAPVAEARKRSPAAFIAGSIAVLSVVGLIAYGYFPSQRAGKPNKAGESRTGAAAASRRSIKNKRGKVAKASSVSPARAPAARSAAVVAKKAPVPVKAAAKPLAVPRPVIAAPKVVRAAAAAVPKAVRPQPQRQKPQPPIVRSAPAPVAVVATPRPEPKAAIVKPAARPAAKPAPPQQLPKASRPNSESIESDGTNPLGLPQ